MDFVLTLHGHLPYVLHHGRWPHGSVWLCEGALDSYLPLIEALQALEREHIPAPITLGITPVLANQLAHPSFLSEFEAYMERRLEAARHAPASLAQSGDLALRPIAEFWQQRLERLYALFHSLGGDLIGTLRGFEARGVIEGEIAPEPRGTEGFGYDPVFWVPQHSATMAELPDHQKNIISHRARAVAGARQILKELLYEHEREQGARS